MYEMSIDGAGQEERVRYALMSGLCCSQAIAKLCLEDLGKENDELVAAMKAFCDGMGEGKICGAIAAAVAMLYVSDDPVDDPVRMQRDLMDWFYDRFGGLDCEELVHDDPLRKIEFCPGCVIETYFKLRDDFLGI
ncbi:MAG: C-GCAxxG-C-C family protein [Clostridiales Family XIII bacterium]|jgi:hypothetical protein|nr:C-GCAxxG-C-C family protein [Clostridiales Family XIII bacterium]